MFGRTGSTPIELYDVAFGNGGGFVINRASTADRSSFSVSSAGDVNGDGLADLITSSPGANSGNGRSFVVFGKTSTGAVDLAAVAAGTGGFVIEGYSDSVFGGSSVSGAGDVNGDGLADVIVGAKWADPGGLGDAGTSFVVFGQTGTAPVDLSAVAAGTGGFVITGGLEYGNLGTSVSSAGDVNGDGLADLIVGAPNYGVGNSYVVFGRTDTAAVDLSPSAANSGGFIITGVSPGDRSGNSQ